MLGVFIDSIHGQDHFGLYYEVEGKTYYAHFRCRDSSSFELDKSSPSPSAERFEVNDEFCDNIVDYIHAHMQSMTLSINFGFDDYRDLLREYSGDGKVGVTCVGFVLAVFFRFRHLIVDYDNWISARPQCRVDEDDEYVLTVLDTYRFLRLKSNPRNYARVKPSEALKAFVYYDEFQKPFCFECLTDE